MLPPDGGATPRFPRHLLAASVYLAALCAVKLSFVVLFRRRRWSSWPGSASGPKDPVRAAAEADARCAATWSRSRCPS